MAQSEVDWSAIFVHAGAGYHSHHNEPQHLKACAAACRAAMAILRNGGSAVDGVEMALKSLEDNEITNSGTGSNLALDGIIECDASIMEENGRSGAVAAADRFKNPSSLARLVLDHSRTPMSLKRVPPMFICGQGAIDFAREHKFPLVDNKALVTASAHSRWKKWRHEMDKAEKSRAERVAAAATPLPHDSTAAQGQKHATILPNARRHPTPHAPHPSPLNPNVSVPTARPEKQSDGPVSPVKDQEHHEIDHDQDHDHITDTVGAICVDRWGRVAAGSSSGGIGMKHRGRVGPAALIGIGTWVKTDKQGKTVAATCSGTGEQMAQTLIASRACDRMLNNDDELKGLEQCIERDFMGAPVVIDSPLAAAVGIMTIKLDKVGPNKRIHFCYGHTTDSMALAHQSTSMSEVEAVMSRNKRNPKVCMGGSIVKALPLQK